MKRSFYYYCVTKGDFRNEYKIRFDEDMLFNLNIGNTVLLVIILQVKKELWELMILLKIISKCLKRSFYYYCVTKGDFRNEYKKDEMKND